MIKQISQWGGAIGNVIGMIMMPCCFPIMISILAWFGVYTFSMGPATLYLITGSMILMTIGHIIHSRQTRQYYLSIISLCCTGSSIYYLFSSGNVWLYYIGLVGMFGVSLYQFISSRRSTANDCCKV